MKSSLIHFPVVTACRSALACLVTIVFMAGLVIAGNGHFEELQIQKCWEYKQDGIRMAATDGANVYFVRDSAMIEAVSAGNGKKLWSSDIGGTVDSNLVVSGENVIMIRGAVAVDGKSVEPPMVQALSSSTGVAKWRSAASGDSAFKLALTPFGVLAISLNGVMQAFDPSNGIAKWERRTGSGGSIGSFWGTNGLFVTGGTDIHIFPFYAAKAATVINGRYDVSTVGSSNGDSFLWGDRRGNLYRYSTSTGKVIWQFKSGGTISNIIVAESHVYASSDDNFVYALGNYNGNRLWKRRIGGRVASIASLGDNILIVRPVGDDNLVLIDAASGKIAGQVSIGAGESPTDVLVLNTNQFVVLSDTGLRAFAVGECIKE